MDKESVYKELKRKIFIEDFIPGRWLVERDISAAYKLSRTPVREILRRLSVDGLVTLEPSKGYIVRKLNLEEVIEIFQSREAVEGMCARLAALRGDNEFLSLLKKLKSQLEKIKIETEKDCAIGNQIGRQLHEAIIDASNNTVLAEFSAKLINLAALTRNITEKSIDIEENSRKGHIAIANALLQRNEIVSEKRMREHLRDTCRVLMQSNLLERAGLRKRVSWFIPERKSDSIKDEGKDKTNGINAYGI